MTRGTLVALALCALILLAVPWIIGNEFYVNMASQVLIYALFALSINMMLGYGGMVSLVLGTNIVRRELGLPEALCPAADGRYSLVVPVQ